MAEPVAIPGVPPAALARARALLSTAAAAREPVIIRGASGWCNHYRRVGDAAVFYWRTAAPAPEAWQIGREVPLLRALGDLARLLAAGAEVVSPAGDTTPGEVAE